jgi:hypothetical protein
LANRPPSLRKDETKTKTLKIDVAVERLDRWALAAERMNCSVTEWIIAALDRAAAPESCSENQT